MFFEIALLHPDPALTTDSRLTTQRLNRNPESPGGFQEGCPLSKLPALPGGKEMTLKSLLTDLPSMTFATYS